MRILKIGIAQMHEIYLLEQLKKIEISQSS